VISQDSRSGYCCHGAGTGIRITPAKSVFEFGRFHPGRQNCIDSIDYKRSTLIVAPSYQSHHRRFIFCDCNSFMKHENQFRLRRIIFRCSYSFDLLMRFLTAIINCFDWRNTSMRRRFHNTRAFKAFSLLSQWGNPVINPFYYELSVAAPTRLILNPLSPYYYNYVP
jgi:hypothetical protein